MKTYNFYFETGWTFKPSLTKEQFSDFTKLPKKNKKAFIEGMKKVPASEKEIQVLDGIINKHKPTLTETDSYQLISAVVSILDSGSEGIMIVKHNGEHKSIKF